MFVFRARDPNNPSYLDYEGDCDRAFCLWFQIPVGCTFVFMLILSLSGWEEIAKTLAIGILIYSPVAVLGGILHGCRIRKEYAEAVKENQFLQAFQQRGEGRF